jgi:hypothetical protein
LTLAARQATLDSGPSFQPPNSAHQRTLNTSVQTEPEDSVETDIEEALGIELSTLTPDDVND